MQKDFDGWNKEKKKLHVLGYTKLHFHTRDIWWCSIGVNLGWEQDGKNNMYERPVLVIKKFNNGLAWVLPMSTKEKSGKYYFTINYNQNNFVIILSQLRLVSTKRFRRYIRKLSKAEFVLVLNQLISILKN